MVEAQANQEEEKAEQTFLEVPAILDQLKAASVITNAALAKAKELCVSGADVYTVCMAVDNYIEAELKNIYNTKKTKKIERGISFPCCLSINQMMVHFSPLPEDSVQMADGDVVKILLGCHFDGFASNAAVTHVCGEAKVGGKQADVIMACYHAQQAAQRAIRIGNTNMDVTAAIGKVCAEYEVNVVEGVLSHKIKKHVIDGNDVIIGRETADQHVKEYEFAPGDVFGLDVYVSSGEGKPKEAEQRCTVFKRELQTAYNLKMKSSRAFFSEMSKRFPTLPFSIRNFEDTTAAKVGVKECLEHGLLLEYDVLTEKAGETVAQFKSTVALLPRSAVVLSGNLPFDASRFSPEHPLQSEEVKELVNREMWAKEKPKKK